MLKRTGVVLSGFIALFSCLVLISNFAYGASNKNKNPFKAIWNKLADHEERLVALEEQPVLSVATRAASDSITVAAYETGSISVLCADSEILTGGGFEQITVDGSTPMSILKSGPVSGSGEGLVGWMASAENRTNQEQSLVVYAICMSDHS